MLPTIAYYYIGETNTKLDVLAYSHISAINHQISYISILPYL